MPESTLTSFLLRVDWILFASRWEGEPFYYPSLQRNNARWSGLFGNTAKANVPSVLNKNRGNHARIQILGVNCGVFHDVVGKIRSDTRWKTASTWMEDTTLEMEAIGLMIRNKQLEAIIQRFQIQKSIERNKTSSDTSITSDSFPCWKWRYLYTLIR